MKHVRTFESLNIKDTIKVGDYVVCKENKYGLDNNLLVSFLATNLGVIKEIVRHDVPYPFYVKYENIPDEIRKNFMEGVRTFSIEEVRLAIKEEIENQKILNDLNKYNL